MNCQYTFERVEAKYILDRKTCRNVLKDISQHIVADVYPHSDITSIYFDSDDFRLIRHSLDKPDYKEKLRLRCYGEVNENSQVFMEIKKKYDGITYKRRQDMDYRQAMKYVVFDRMPVDSQIMKEIDYCRNGSDSQLNPKCLINYQRDSYACLDDENLRITFDYDIRFTLDDLVLTNRNYQGKLLDDDKVILEIKMLHNMPLWLSATLDRYQLYPASYSKYGTVYQQYIMKGAKPCLQHYSHQYIPAVSLPSITSYAHSVR